MRIECDEDGGTESISSVIHATDCAPFECVVSIINDAYMHGELCVSQMTSRIDVVTHMVCTFEVFM